MLTSMTGTMKSALVALSVCWLLTSCGGGSGPGPASEASKPSPSPSSTPEPELEPELVSMLQACPEVEAVLPNGFIPGFGKMSTYVDRLNELDELGDTETQNALGLLIPAATELMLAVARDARGSELTDPIGAHLDGLSAFANRCAASGSSALQ